MARILLLLSILLPGCAASTAVGASAVTAAALGTSMAQRAAGGCYAVCTGGTVCNPRTGLCDAAPCGGLCKADEHCEESATESKCVPGATASGVAAKAPGTEKVIPVLPPIPPLTGDPQRVIPAAEQNPPSHK